MPRRPRSPNGEDEEDRNVRGRPSQPQLPQPQLPQPQLPQPQLPQPQPTPVRNHYQITSRIDPSRLNDYSYEQIAVAPFLPNGPHPIMPHLSELFHSKVSAYRAMQPEDIPKVIVLIRMRLAFKKLVGAAIRRRCDKIPFQDVDPITLSSFERPIILYDIKNHCRHKFEAKSLMVHIHRQLLHSNMGFAEPLAPRNPLTNIELTYGQLISCYFQLRDAGQSIWTISSFYSTNFNLHRFAGVFERPLRHASIQTLIHDEMNEFSADQFVRFIQVYATHSNIPISGPNIFVLRYAAIMRSEDYYMLCWKRLYLVAMTHGMTDGPINAIFNDLETVSQARGLVVLTRILSQNLLIYIREIRPAYDRFVEENESKEDNDEDSIFDEDSEEEILSAYQHLLQNILGPGAGTGASNTNRG